MRVAGLGVDYAAEEGLRDDGDDGADADAAEGEAGDAGGPAAVLGEDDGVGEEAEVEDAVDERDPVTLMVSRRAGTRLTSTALQE